MKRTHNCGELRLENVSEDVTLMGWVNTRRDHGGLVFIDLRDRSGVVQIVFNPKIDTISHAKAHALRNEYVIEVEGVVQARPKGTINPTIPTGEIEVMVHRLEILNTSLPLPFSISEETTVSEDIRLRYRYLDLRRSALQRNLILRHNIYQEIRRFLSDAGFVEIETPFLIKSTPEGARDYIIPSRVNPGKFYALPQSPQLFKQILMVAGFDKYFQIVRCFRDEDLRADRQPEFTQIDLEMSFVDEEDIFCLMEDLMAHIFKKGIGVEIPRPFPRLTFQEAMDRFGTDKPETRFGLELIDITDLAQESGFQVFNKVAKSGGKVKGIRVEDSLSRSEIDNLTSFVSIYGAKGLAYFKVLEGNLESPIAKFFSQDLQTKLLKRMGAKSGDLLLFVADKSSIVAQSLSALRLYLGKKLNLIPNSGFSFTWITDPLLFEYNESERRLESMHHPFTHPRLEDIPYLETCPEKVHARAYDLVLNGVEIGGGSIRIHTTELQEEVFKILGLPKEEVKKRFGFLLEALSYGAPPHGGIAIGLDRLLRIILNCNSIREVIAFPKTQSATCLMTDAPFDVDSKQLKELHIKLDLE
ncbi:MAG: aspartate--tRNA ligase [bacterium]|nr:aspartate--tRNA ligase [bacterium]